MSVVQTGVDIVYYSYTPLENTFLVVVITAAIVAGYGALMCKIAPTRLRGGDEDGLGFFGNLLGVITIVALLLGGATHGINLLNKNEPNYEATYAAIEDYYNLTLPESSVWDFLSFEQPLDLGPKRGEGDEPVEAPMYNVPGADGTRYEEGVAVIEDGKVTFMVTDKDGKKVELDHDTVLDLNDDK